MAEIVRRRSWGGVLPLGRDVSISGSRSIHAPSVRIAPSSFQEEQNARHHKQFKLEQALVLQLHLCCRCGSLLGACGRGGASMSVAVWSGSLVAWERELAALKGRIGPVFGRAEVRETAGAFLDGLLSGVGRKTGWLLAEQAGLERPYRIQSLLGRSRGDADALRDRVRACGCTSGRGSRCFRPLPRASS